MSAIDSASEPSALSIRSTSGADAPAFGVPTLTCSERPGIVRAVRWHCQHRILFHGASTVVFR